jgi:hypothetical protein
MAQYAPSCGIFGPRRTNGLIGRALPTTTPIMAERAPLRRLMRIALPAALGLASGCFFEDPPAIDPPGASTGDEPETSGTSTTSMPGEDGTSSTSGTVDDGTSLEPDGGSTDPSSASDGSSSGGDEPSTGEPSTGEPCNAELPSIHWASDAVLTDPMMLTTAIYLPGMPQMAYSSTAEAGTITFAFELACPATITVQGLVWDYSEGVEPANPDSFYATIDGLPAPELEWAYGCATEGLGDESWSWQPLASVTRNGCATEPFEVELAAGTHELTLRNREAGSGLDIAGIAAIVVTDDPGLDASTLYDPSP